MPRSTPALAIAATLALLGACAEDPAQLDEDLGELAVEWCEDPPVPFLTGGPINIEEPAVRTVGLTTYLYFSDRLPDERRDLHVAVWVAGIGFVHLGPVSGVNTAAGLEGAPSIDGSGYLYFTDSAAPGMISRGLLLWPSLVSAPRPVVGMPPVSVVGDRVEGNMDIGVAQSLPIAALSRAVWQGGSPLPLAADLWYLRRLPDGSVLHVPFETLYFFGALATPLLEYAPEFSPSGLELFYTQLDPATGVSRILIASRPRLDFPFAGPRVVAVAAPGTLIEGPTVTVAGDRLFFHEVHFDGRPTSLRTMHRCAAP